MSDDLVNVSREKWILMGHAFREATQRDGRFTGTTEEQSALAEQMRELLNHHPGGHAVLTNGGELRSLADELQNAEKNWPIGVYFSRFESLAKINKHGYS